jgi:creatinine amidohydrolase
MIIMKQIKSVLFWLALPFIFSESLLAQASGIKILPVNYEDLTVPLFMQALDRSARTCIIPLGILEKHGNHLPLGTDLINIRTTAIKAAMQEYVVVFPKYYVGQINEARHQPGTIAYSPELIWMMMEETLDELSRNGFNKILLVNGHGGNNWLEYFSMSLLHKKKDYAVYVYGLPDESIYPETVKKLTKTNDPGGHAGEFETSAMMVNRPELVHKESIEEETGADLQRLKGLDVYTGIWWYAQFPNHYNTGGSAATAELGKAIVDAEVADLVRMIREIKKDTRTLQLQEEFYKQSENPLLTPQDIMK